MSVQLTFHCDGCGATAEGMGTPRKRFESFSGRGHGFGVARWDEALDGFAPEGWVAADPITYCTYCPTCWASIEAAADKPLVKP